MLSLVFFLPLLRFMAPEVRAEEPTADTATDERAKELYENGADLYDEGRYDDAVAAWEESYKLSNRPLLLYNIANAEERAGHYDLALDRLNRYRAFATASERDILDRRIRNLEQRIDQSSGSGAATTGASPTNPSSTSAPATSSGTAPATAPATSSGSTGSPPASSSAPTAPVRAGSSTTVKRQGPSMPTYILGGVGLVGIGAGAVFGLEATTARRDAANLCQADGEQTLCTSEAQPALARDKLDSLLADISFGVGGAAAIGAVVVALLDEPIGFTPLPDGGILTFGRQF